MALDGSLKTSIAGTWQMASRLVGQAPALTILYYHAVPDHLRDAFARQMQILAAEAEVVFAEPLWEYSLQVIPAKNSYKMLHRLS
jgi:hypothetical protein